MATHSSILAWRILWTEEPGGLQSMESQRVGHDWATNTCDKEYGLCLDSNFCIWISNILALLVEKILFFQLNYLCAFTKNKWLHLYGSISGLSVLFHRCIFLFYYQYHNILLDLLIPGVYFCGNLIGFVFQGIDSFSSNLSNL